MHITCRDIRALVKYLDKENLDDDEWVKLILNEDSLDTKAQFAFQDSEQRDCCITISVASLKRAVRLTKSMDLITRLEPKKE